jgi:hypothetical protein
MESDAVASPLRPACFGSIKSFLCEDAADCERKLLRKDRRSDNTRNVGDGVVDKRVLKVACRDPTRGRPSIL